MSSLSGIRVHMFNENFLNENEQDANSVLTELDKGLRSAKIGVQCEAIVRFPRLFEKYPFPILINSSFLKLAEFFWSGSNLLRFWVLKVCQQSENHLDKILNIDAFVKRIFMVSHSNDPVARALTLRTLGAVSRVIPEKQQVHHSIRRALDSHDTVEVEAAIYASGQFAAQSKSFAISMCSKIATMIESLQTPVSMKLQLIPVLRHMHHDANTAAMVKDLCLNLLPKYPAESFVIAILDSLTKLSSQTLIGIPEQVDLLLTYLQDPRQKVRCQVLKSLKTLANQKSAHSWPKGSLKNLITKAKTCVEGTEQTLVLTVVLTLTECPLTCHALLNEEQSLIIELCSSCLNLENHTAASQALAILKGLVLYCHTNSTKPPEVIIELINIHLESLIFSSVGDENHTKELKKYLICGVKISEANNEFGEDFIEMIGDLLSDEITYPKKHSELLCETLAALSSKFQLRKFITPKVDTMETDDNQPSDVVNPVAERLPQMLKKLNAIVDGDCKDESRIIEILSAVILQSLIGCFLPSVVLDTFDRIASVSNCWTLYRIGRSASRYGQHFLAARFFIRISKYASMDKFNFFLVGVAQMAKAECILNYGLEYDTMCQHYNLCDPKYTNNQLKLIPLIERLDMAISLYWEALASLRASSSATSPLTFQLEFIKLRAQFLQTLFSVVTAKNAQTIIPPPAIAASLAQNSRDYLQKFGHVTNQLRKVVKSIKGCEESYLKLYKTAFDADTATLEFLELTEYQCALFGNIIEGVCYASPSEPPLSVMNGQFPETKYLINTCGKMEILAQNLPQEPGNAKTITNRHMDVITSEIELIVKTPVCMPRYFFQTLQATQIKLSVSPQPRAAGEHIIVQSGSNLVIKVEGVIQHYGKCPSLFRSVDSVQLSLTSQLMTPRVNTDCIKPPSDLVTLTQIVKPQRDFLSGSFLLPISIGGQWNVTLETFVIDEVGITWSTGPKSSMIVRVLDDPNKPQPASTSASNIPARRF